MADFDLSMVIRGDGSSAAAAATQVETGLEGVATAQARVTRTSRDMQSATSGAAAAEQEVGRAAQEATAATNTLGAAQEELARDFQEARAGATAAASGATAAARAQRDAARAANDNAAAQNRAAFGARNLGQQVGDFATQVSLGGGVIRAFSSQIGQAGFAMSEMGGKIGAVGRFLTGPWGIALTVGALVLAPFVEKLFDGAKAADEQSKRLEQAAQAADSYGTAQSLIGKIIDLTTGKIKTQNVALIQQIKLLAQANILTAQKQQKEAADKLGGIGKPTFGETFIDSLAGAGGSSYAPDMQAGERLQKSLQARANSLAPLKKVLDDYVALTNIPGASQGALDKGLTATIRAIDALGKSGKLAGRDLIDTKQAVLSLATAVNDQKANQLVVDAASGKPLDPLLKPYERAKKPKAPKKPKVDTTTPREAEEIQRINEEFDRTPTLIDKAAQATRKLDKIIADLTKRKPPGFEKLIADANVAKQTIQEGLQRPYQDFIRDQQQALEVQKLLTAGKVDEANALKTIQSLQATMGPLTGAQKDAVLATVQALRMEQRELDILRQKNAKYVEAIGGIKGIVEDATQAFVRGDLGRLLQSPGKILDVFQTFSGRQLFDKVFGDAFRELEDQANGTSVIKDASDRMATAVDKASASIIRLGNAADQAAGGIAGAGGAGVPGGASTVNAEGDIVVNGKRNPVVSSIGKIGEKIAGLFTDPEKASKIGASIGKFAGKGLEGAATGSVVSGIGKALGIKMSSTGAQIGGAIGNFLPIPGGSIIGSIAGGLLGGLFGKKAAYGTATVTGAGQGGVALGGNKANAKSGAGTLAGAVQDGVEQVAKQLGGTLGSYLVSIGTYDGKFRVSTSGQTGSLDFGKKNKQKSTLYDFGDDQAGAIAFAIADAIKDGAVQGLSAAVKAALASSSDVDKALQEALGVKALETALGGLKAQLKDQFDAEDQAAKERVRLARTYGLDIVATEKYNAEQRAKLVDDTLKARIGSLSDFLDQLKFGDLAEGTASEKRAALLDKIKSVQADAEAGKEGAADQLAQLYSQLVSGSREAFGTAGTEYTTDRGAAVSGVERVIQMERDRVNQAAGINQSTTDAVNQNNALTSETNDLLAVAVTRLTQIASAGGNASSGGVDLAAVTRSVSLA